MNGSSPQLRAALVDAIRQHQRRQSVRDLKTHCICQWPGEFYTDAAHVVRDGEGIPT